MEHVLPERQLVTALLPCARESQEAPGLLARVSSVMLSLDEKQNHRCCVFLVSRMVTFLTPTSGFMAAEVPEPLQQINSRDVLLGSKD